MSLRSDKAFTIVELLIAMAISMGAILIFNIGLLQSNKADRKGEVDRDIAEAKFLILSKLDCTRTLNVGASNPTKCNQISTGLDLLDQNGDAINPQSKIAALHTRVSCVDNQLEIGLWADGIDPLTGTKYADQPLANDVFGGLSGLCYQELNQIADESDLQCFNIKRSSALMKTDPNAISTVPAFAIGHAIPFLGPVDGQDSWGATCGEGYARIGCAINNPGPMYFNFDINLIPNGCVSDDEEYAGDATISINCCKLN